jgi:hypothetical protein
VAEEEEAEQGGEVAGPDVVRVEADGARLNEAAGREGGAVEEDQLEVGLEGGDREEPALAGCG